MLCMFVSVVCAFGLIRLLEYGWSNRPPAWANQWPKARAMRFAWAGIGLMVVLGQLPVGILMAAAGLPVCLAHLRLVDRNSATEIRITNVAIDLYRVAQSSVRRLFDRTRIGPR